MPVGFQSGQSQFGSFCHIGKEVDKADGGGSEVDAGPWQSLQHCYVIVKIIAELLLES
jgi:hypothetical protein